jgi:hypothetical protein
VSDIYLDIKLFEIRIVLDYKEDVIGMDRLQTPGIHNVIWSHSVDEGHLMGLRVKSY